MVTLPKEFYTTAEQEAELDEIYQKELVEKQKEIDAEYKRTRKIPKYRSTMYIDKKERVFFICEKGLETQILWKDASGSVMPTEKQPGGKVYRLDTAADGTGLIKKYCKDYSEFYIKFKSITSGGIAYCAEENIHPAVLECPAHKLIVEDDNKYDLYCL
jgi:hypothetical protein